MIDGQYPDLAGKSVLICGARPLGRLVAQGFAAQGGKVALAHGPDDLGEVEDDGAALLDLPCDLADPVALQDAIAGACEENGPVGILVNLAGGAPAPLMNFDPEAFERDFVNDLRAFYIAAQATLPFMVAQGGGAIVNCSALPPSDAGGAWLAQQSAIVGLTRALAEELTDVHVRVNALVPCEGGLVEGQRPPDPAELVEPALFLSSLASQEMSGRVVPVGDAPG